MKTIDIGLLEVAPFLDELNASFLMKLERAAMS